jgi:hypothetical protein
VPSLAEVVYKTLTAKSYTSNAIYAAAKTMIPPILANTPSHTHATNNPPTREGIRENTILVKSHSRGSSKTISISI